MQKMITQKICGRYTEDVFDIIRMLSCLIRCSVVIYNIEYPANLIKRFIYSYTAIYVINVSGWNVNLPESRRCLHRRYAEDMQKILLMTLVYFDIYYDAQLD